MGGRRLGLVVTANPTIADPPRTAPAAPVPPGVAPLVRVVVPRYWVALLALAVFLGGIVVWSIFGTLENRVDGGGALIPGGSVVEMHVPVDSVLQSYAVAVGGQVTKGQTVATVLTPEGAAIALAAPESGQVSALNASSGEALQTGEVVALLASSTAPLEAVGALPAEDTNAVKVGDTVRVTPVGLNSSNLGTITGTVVSISTLPVSAAELGATLGSDSLASALTGAGPVKAVTVSLQHSHKSGSVYSVSDAQGQSVPLQFGTAVQLQVVTSSQRPIDKVLK